MHTGPPQIGKGHYGIVYSGTDRKTQAPVAIKVLDKRRSKVHRLELEVSDAAAQHLSWNRPPGLLAMLGLAETLAA